MLGKNLTAVRLTDTALSLTSRFMAALAFAVMVWPTSVIGQTIQYNRDVRPILAENCFYCHGNDAKHRMADLRLDVREDAIDAGAVLPEDPDESLLIQRIESTDDADMMPPPESKKHLTPEQKEILRQWIAQGAPYEPHWAFSPPQSQTLPADWPKHPIDYFIQRRLSEEGLEPSPPAALNTLIRRVALDLTGLPPTRAEVDAFVSASATDPEAAYRELVERLLASEHYGERWGRWWLDQARYADSNGYSIDAPREIWSFRDWVINAFNQDLPFDQFTLEQLAGDLLPGSTIQQQVATGFHRNTQINQEGGIDPEQFRIDSIFDRVATTGTVWLGLTVGCAQCHDHKFDPIDQAEYYRLFAFFNNQDEPTLKVFSSNEEANQTNAALRDTKQQISKLLKEASTSIKEWEATIDEEAAKNLSDEVNKVLKIASDKRNDSQLATLVVPALGGEHPLGVKLTGLQQQQQTLERKIAQTPSTMVLRERREPRTTTVFINGDFTRPDEVVTPGTPKVLHPLPSPAESQTPLTRLDLARWIVSPENPLTSRVIANRVWQQYFGRGIVETENDFGLQGTLPSHPELLDWLANEFRQRGWSLKELHRLIVTSHVYRQSSQQRNDLAEADPNNYLLGRQQRLRLDAEIVRDVALAASGLLTKKIGGPSVFPPIPAGVMSQGQVKRDWKESQGEDRYRRSLYTFVFRGSPPPMLSVFDAPEGLSTCTRRIRSNTPLQSLTVLNDKGFFEFARALQQIIEAEGIEVAFFRCTTRPPEPQEIAILSDLDSLSAARVLLNLDETMTRE